MSHLAVVFDRQTMATKPVENLSVLRLAIRVVPPSDTCGNNSIRGAWRLVARVPRQAVWKPFVPGDSYGAPGDFLIKQTLCFACFGCAWSTRLWAISQR